MKNKLTVIVIGLLCIALIGAGVFAAMQTVRLGDTEDTKEMRELKSELRETKRIAVSHMIKLIPDSEWTTAAKDNDMYKFYVLDAEGDEGWTSGCLICRINHSWPTDQENVRKAASWEDVVGYLGTEDASRSCFWWMSESYESTLFR